MDTKSKIQNQLHWEQICRHYQIDFTPNKNVNCPFHEDSSPSLSFFGEQQFKCHGCGVSGDMFSFIAQKENLDCKNSFPEILQVAERITGTNYLDESQKQKPKPVAKKKITTAEIEERHQQLLASPQIIEYFENRGISLDILKENQIGFGTCKATGGRKKIFIPYFDATGEPLFFRYRSWEKDDSVKIFASKNTSLIPYLLQHAMEGDDIFIVEGEIDALMLMEQGIPCVGIPSAQTFKEDWIPYFKQFNKITICLDNDEAGIKGTEKIIDLLQKHLPNTDLFRIKWPDDFSHKGDVNDFFCSNGAENSLLVDTFMNLCESVPKQSQCSVDAKIDQYLKLPTAKKVFPSDVIEDTFFHTFPVGEDFFVVLLSNGERIEVQKEKTEKPKDLPYFFEYNDKVYHYRVPLLQPPPEISRPDKNSLIPFIKKQVPGSEFYENLCDFIDEFYEFFCEEEKHIVIANIIHSYFINAIGNTFYLLLEGELGTGKSTLQTLTSLLQYNGSFSGKITMPSMVRNIHFFQAAMNIDEFDKISREEKSLATGVLNTGFSKNGTYSITNMNNKNVKDQCQSFHTFGTKSFSLNKKNLDRSLVSRCLTINTVRMNRRVKNIFRLSTHDEERFQELRNQMFVFCLSHWKDLIDSIQKVKHELEERSVFGRRTEVFSIVCGIYEYFRKKHDLRAFLLKKELFEIKSERENSKEYFIFLYITEQFLETDTDTVILNATEIHDYIERHMDVEEDKEIPSARSIGKLLITLRITNEETEHITQTTGEKKGRKLWIVPKVHILDLLKRSEYTELKERLTQDKRYNATNEDVNLVPQQLSLQ